MINHLIRPALVFAVSTLFFFGTSCNSANDLSSSMTVFPADGVSGGKVRLVKHQWRGDDLITGPFGDTDAILLLYKKTNRHGETVAFQSTMTPGKVFFLTKGGKKLYLTFYKNRLDIDNDGFPDEAELVANRDREAFRKWFVRIAESQFLKKNYSWKYDQRDCAGLIRFAYREALNKHDADWNRISGIVIDKNLPDIQCFHYPDIPVIGARLFKISTGSADDRSSFGNFADAETLLKYNMDFISMDIKDAREGDILFFQNVDNDRFPYHSMIVTENGTGRIMLLYHTGTGDVVKRIDAKALYANRLFTPEKRNRHFLGVYRFSILENGI